MSINQEKIMLREYARGLRILAAMGELVTLYELRLAMRRALNQRG